MLRNLVLVAVLMAGFPAVSGACDGLFANAAERQQQRQESRQEKRANSRFGFGLFAAAPAYHSHAETVVTTKTTTSHVETSKFAGRARAMPAAVLAVPLTVGRSAAPCAACEAAKKSSKP